MSTYFEKYFCVLSHKGDVITVGKCLFDIRKTIIFAPESDKKHIACVWIVRDPTQKLPEIFAIVARLRAAGLVGKCIDAVNRAAFVGFFRLCKPYANIVYAPDSGDDVDLTADACASVFAPVTPKRGALRRRRFGLKIISVRAFFT